MVKKIKNFVGKVDAEEKVVKVDVGGTKDW
jgi:hypothetical protein